MKYTNGYFSVDVASDGAIVVKPGECLSMYSAAIYDDFFRLDHFVRRTAGGAFEPIRDYNAVLAYETLVHIPTYLGFMGSRAMAFLGGIAAIVRRFYENLGLETPVLTESDRKRIMAGITLETFDIPCESLVNLMRGLDAFGPDERASTVLGFAELLENRLLGAGMLLLGRGGLLADALYDAVDSLSRFEADQRSTGLKAIAACTAAWACGDIASGFPEGLRQCLQHSRKSLLGWLGFTRRLAGVHGHEAAWNNACRVTLRRLDGLVSKTGCDAASVQRVLLVAGGNSRHALERRLLAELQEWSCTAPEFAEPPTPALSLSPR